MLTTNVEQWVEPISAQVTPQVLTVRLSDGRTISAPTAWFPRLANGTEGEWANFEMSPLGIHWPELNEDISIEGLLNGERSGESKQSIDRWLELRARGLKESIPELPLSPEMELELRELGII